MRDFLVEIQTEELPPKALKRLATRFSEEIARGLEKAALSFKKTDYFATPRRLAVLVTRLAEKQKETTQERKGPALKAAFDAEGRPTPACMGFARSLGIEPEQLITLKNPQGEWVGYLQTVPGKSVNELLPNIVQLALQALPIPKRMRWGAGDIEFVRPVHSVLMLYGQDIIPATILGLTTDRKTSGHRFLSQGLFTISRPSRYLKRLASKYVLADFAERKEKIREEAELIVKKQLGDHACAFIQDDLLDEVTGLVEWPSAILGSFDEAFLKVPQEALISAMQEHQRYFPVVDQDGKLLPHFVTISNIPSLDSERILTGNERVLRARLSDASFFYETDLKQSLHDRLPLLKDIIFQDKLGTLHDKAKRLSHLTAYISDDSVELAKEAGLLAKADLTTQLVGEFPELQGIAGYYYALSLSNDKEHHIAMAIRDQYRPRFSGDQLPETALGSALAMADRIDTLVGVFGIHQAPTSEKDPFGLRRAALGVLRILIEKELNLDLRDLLQEAIKNYPDALPNKNTADDVLQFMLERLKPWYQERDIAADIIHAVTALSLSRPYDIHLRIQAVRAFKSLPEAEALSIANKRVSNILAKYPNDLSQKKINSALFESDAETNLATQLSKADSAIATYAKTGNYTEILNHLATLREPIDAFFDNVLVMTDDIERRENRLVLLKQLRELFLHVADIALLQ